MSPDWQGVRDPLNNYALPRYDQRIITDIDDKNDLAARLGSLIERMLACVAPTTYLPLHLSHPPPRPERVPSHYNHMGLDVFLAIVHFSLFHVFPDVSPSEWDVSWRYLPCLVLAEPFG